MMHLGSEGISLKTEWVKEGSHLLSMCGEGVHHEGGFLSITQIAKHFG